MKIALIVTCRTMNGNVCEGSVGEDTGIRPHVVLICDLLSETLIGAWYIITQTDQLVITLSNYRPRKHVRLIVGRCVGFEISTLRSIPLSDEKLIHLLHSIINKIVYNESNFISRHTIRSSRFLTIHRTFAHCLHARSSCRFGRLGRSTRLHLQQDLLPLLQYFPRIRTGLPIRSHLEWSEP